MTLIELLVVLAIVAIPAAILFPVFPRPNKGSARRASCQSNLKLVGLAFLQYAQDYDEQFPRVALSAVPSSVAPFKTPFGWADGIQPYLRTTQLLQCPSDTSLQSQDATQSGFTDYWMNLNLANQKLEKVKTPDMTFLGGDGNDGRDGSDARYNRDVIPKLWTQAEDSPARRHLDMGNYLFADGHVKALKLNALNGSGRSYSFALKVPLH